MKTTGYLVLVHLASKLSRNNLAAIGATVRDALRRNLANSAAVVTSDVLIGAVGLSDRTAAELFSMMSADLRTGDNLSITSLGPDLITSHPGLAEWARSHRH